MHKIKEIVVLVLMLFTININVSAYETESYYLKNAHGDVTGIANAGGTITAEYVYDSFGNILTATPNTTNPFGYCREYTDNESGMVYLRNRYYVPKWHTFEKAKFFANNHEIAELKRLGWISSINGNVVETKMNQPTLMDLWNNSTGRALGVDINLAAMGYGQVMAHALTYGMVITDATKTYEFYSVTDYINSEDYTVNVKWNIETGTLTFKKENLPDLTLMIGKWGL